jgi:ABC-type sulfate transport system permease subunit
MDDHLKIVLNWMCQAMDLYVGQVACCVALPLLYALPLSTSVAHHQYRGRQVLQEVAENYVHHLPLNLLLLH